MSLYVIGKKNYQKQYIDIFFFINILFFWGNGREVTHALFSFVFALDITTDVLPCYRNRVLVTITENHR